MANPHKKKDKKKPNKPKIKKPKIITDCNTNLVSMVFGKCVTTKGSPPPKNLLLPAPQLEPKAEPKAPSPPRTPTPKLLSPSTSSASSEAKEIASPSSCLPPLERVASGSKRMFETMNAPMMCSNDDDGWTDVVKKGSKKKQPHGFLCNQVSLPKQDSSGTTSCNPIQPPMIPNNCLKTVVGIELQYVSAKTPSVVCERPTLKPVLGMQVTLIVNHFRCTKLPSEDITVYDYQFHPPVKKKETRWALKRDWESKFHDKNLSGKYVTYDGNSQLYVYQSLDFVTREFIYEHLEKNQAIKTFKFTISRKGSQDNEKDTKLASLDLLNYLNGQSHEYPSQYMSVLNFSLKQDICVGDIEHQKNFFPISKNPINLGTLKIHALEGYSRVFKPTQQGLILNVDTFYKLFHERCSILEFIKHLIQFKDDARQMRPELDRNRQRVLMNIRGLVIETNHYVDKMTRNHTITGLTTHSAKTQTIRTNNGNEITIQQYFSDYYDKKIECLELPLLILQSKNPNFMPLELCVIAHNQEVKDQKGFEASGKFNGIMSGSMRIQQIARFVKELYTQRNNHTKSFNVEIDTEPTKIFGRVLPRVALVKAREPREHLFHWGVLNMSTKLGDEQVNMYLETLISALKESNLKVMKHHYLSASQMNMYPVVIMEKIYNKVQSNITNKRDRVNLIVVVLDGRKRNTNYAEIKLWGDCLKGVPTQILAAEAIHPNKKVGWRNYSLNVCLKINCRLGGRNVQFKAWNEENFHTRSIKNIKYGEIIAFGADVTHPDQGSNQPSIAAVVSNLDYSCSYFGARIFTQEPRQELMQKNLQSAITELLQNFKTMNNQKLLPKTIIYFRDGVGDSQFEAVLRDELPQIKDGARVVEANYDPKISLVIVQKRHHTRFFMPENLKTTNKSTMVHDKHNIPLGTVIDTDVCDPQKFDFYLCSHTSARGTPRPAHYYVIYDESNFSADDFENLTYSFCNIFQRSNSPVSMPAPAYYAHLVAYRGRQIFNAAKMFQRRRDGGPKELNLSAHAYFDKIPLSPPYLTQCPAIHDNHRAKMFYI